MTWIRRGAFAVVAAAVAYFFMLPGVSVLRDLTDPAMGAPGIPERARELNRALAPQLEAWARERIAQKSAVDAPLHDVPTTEWPMFTAVFFLMGTEALEKARLEEVNGGKWVPAPLERGRRDAVEAAKDLLLDPSHHTWVRTHWGPGYMHTENFFFRSLIIAGLTSYETITHNGSTLPVLRDQVETLSAELDASPLGMLHDYPDEAYPIDVLAGIAWIRKADQVLGTDHSAFVSRALRGFDGPMADPLGLIPFRMELPSGRHVQESRGIGNSWSAIYLPDLWPERARGMYQSIDSAFWEDHGWAAGFREFPRGLHGEWTFEIDAGPVIDGFGTAASAFGIGAARRNGRFDQAYTLSAEMSAMSWPLPSGTLVGPRVVSNAAAAPYLGEAALMYFLTIQPAPGVPVVTGAHFTPLVSAMLCAYFGFAALVLWVAWRRLLGQERDLKSAT